MRVYIAGPITGTVGYEERFKVRAFELKKFGYEVFNPVPIIAFKQKIAGRTFSHDECMKILIPYLDECDAINLLPGWENSKGAVEERNYAVSHGKTILTLKQCRY